MLIQKDKSHLGQAIPREIRHSSHNILSNTLQTTETVSNTNRVNSFGKFSFAPKMGLFLHFKIFIIGLVL